jgi:hypothetical protein
MVPVGVSRSVWAARPASLTSVLGVPTSENSSFERTRSNKPSNPLQHKIWGLHLGHVPRVR